MTESDGIRPSPNGGAMAKDFWLAGMAVALVCGRGKAKTKIKEVAKAVAKQPSSRRLSGRSVRNAKAPEGCTQDRWQPSGACCAL